MLSKCVQGDYCGMFARTCSKSLEHLVHAPVTGGRGKEESSRGERGLGLD